MSESRLTTHILDTARGCPADGVRIELFRLSDIAPPQLLSRHVTNDDGRTDAPILAGEAFQTGRYELLFHAGDYLRRAGLVEGVTLFLDVVPVRFGLSTGAHFHVPLLLSPFGYSTYRGS